MPVSSPSRIFLLAPRVITSLYVTRQKEKNGRKAEHESWPDRCIPLECAVPGGLRGDPVGLLPICHGTGWRSGPLSEHQTRAAQDRGVVLFGLLRLLLELALFVILLEHLDSAGLLAEEVDHERHGEVVQTLAPRDLHDHVGPDQIVAGVQHAYIALAAANVDKLVNC